MVRKAFRKFQNDSFDLVITDLKLKGMDGLQVSKKIKKINPQIPVIRGHRLSQDVDLRRSFPVWRS